jgi:hypothetical protein
MYLIRLFQRADNGSTGYISGLRTCMARKLRVAVKHCRIPRDYHRRHVPFGGTVLFYLIYFYFIFISNPCPDWEYNSMKDNTI